MVRPGIPHRTGEEREFNHDARNNSGDRCMNMPEDTAERMADKGSAGADQLRNQTIEALEEAARKLRSADLAAGGEQIQDILYHVQDRMDQFREEMGARYEEMEDEYHRRVEPVETIICDHPIPSVLVALGLGFLFGMLIGRRD